MNKTNDLFNKLNLLKIKSKTVDHEPVVTVEDAKSIRKNQAGLHSKNLFLKDKKGHMYLIVCLEDQQVNMKDLKRIIGSSHLSFASPKVLSEVLGVTSGAVSPFALINDIKLLVQVVIEKKLLAAGFINFHPLCNTKTTSIKAKDLLYFLDCCGYKPNIIDLC